MGAGYDGGWAPYVPVAQRRANALKEVEKLKKKGRTITPVVIEGRQIARTFWGTAWCDNLESYSDFANRLPRGRTYVRNGSVVDLQIEPGRLTAIVSGSELYRIEITIDAVAKKKWQVLIGECKGRIGSLVELLKGKLSSSVLEVLARPGHGLFPEPAEMKFACSCPDWASMCKHVAATLYGVGARLDAEPGLLFQLRRADQMELIAQAAAPRSVGMATGRGARRLDDKKLASVFGIDLDAGAAAAGGAEVNAGPALKAKAKPKVKPKAVSRAARSPQRMTVASVPRTRVAKVSRKSPDKQPRGL